MSDQKTYCHICAEIHQHEKLFLLGPTDEGRRTSIVLGNKSECMARFTTEDGFLKAEARFLNRAEIPKVEGEVNRLWFNPGRVSPNTFWNATERTERSAVTKKEQKKEPKDNILHKVFYPCQFL